MILKEGGNVFKDASGRILTQRINQADVAPTLAWLDLILILVQKIRTHLAKIQYQDMSVPRQVLAEPNTALAPIMPEIDKEEIRTTTTKDLCLYGPWYIRNK